MRRPGHYSNSRACLFPAEHDPSGPQEGAAVGALEVETARRGEMPGEGHDRLAPSVPHHRALSPAWRQCRQA